jgi:hypothetical protein
VPEISFLQGFGFSMFWTTLTGPPYVKPEERAIADIGDAVVWMLTGPLISIALGWLWHVFIQSGQPWQP